MNINEFHPADHTTIPEMLYRNARKFPNKPAVIFKDTVLTYSDLDRLSNRFANALIASGVKKGDHVALMMNNSDKFMVAYFGVQKSGAVVININTKYVRPEVEYILTNSDATTFVFSSALENNIHGIEELGLKYIVEGDCPSYAKPFDEFLMNASDSRPEVTINEDDFSTILYTSGTTGKPSGAIFTHYAVNANAYVSTINHKLGISSKNLIMMPLFHSSPLHNHALGTLWPGGTLVILEKFDIKEFLETIQRERTTHFFGPAMVYLNCVKQFDVSQYDLSSMELFVMGGSPCAADDQARIIREMKLEGRFIQVYGLTESGPAGLALLRDEVIKKPGSIGIGGAVGCELYIVDPEGNIIDKPGVVGEIAIFSDSHMTEYYKNPEKTAATIKNGFIMTGDLAMYDEDRYLYFMDRSKDMIISGGQNIFSKEIEDVVMSCPGVLEAAAVGIPHKEWGESVKVVLSVLPGFNITPQSIKDYCKDKLAKFKRPRYVEIVSALPHNSAGKIQKNDIKKLYGEPIDK